MTNSEIRRAARKKCLVRNFALIAMLAYIPSAFGALYSQYTRGNSVSKALTIAILLFQYVVMFLSNAGVARTSLAVWRRGEARYADMTAYVRNGRLFLRGLIVIVFDFLLIYALPLGVLFLVVRSGSYDGYILASLVISLAILLVRPCFTFLFYAIEIFESDGVFRAIGKGLWPAIRNMGRILGMYIALLWWVMFLLFVPLVAAQSWEGTARGAAYAVAALMVLAAGYFIWPHVNASCAALALEIYAGDGAAAAFVAPEDGQIVEQADSGTEKDNAPALEAGPRAEDADQ